MSVRRWRRGNLRARRLFLGSFDVNMRLWHAIRLRQEDASLRTGSFVAALAFAPDSLLACTEVARATWDSFQHAQGLVAQPSYLGSNIALNNDLAGTAGLRARQRIGAGRRRELPLQLCRQRLRLQQEGLRAQNACHALRKTCTGIRSRRSQYPCDSVADVDTHMDPQNAVSVAAVYTGRLYCLREPRLDDEMVL